MTVTPKVLLTGASGLLAHEFIARYRHLYDFFAITHSQVTERFKGVHYVEIDFSKDWDERILPKQVDFIVHLAQSSKFRDFPGSALDVFSVNLLSTMKLLDYSIQAKVRKFVLASTGGVYGPSLSPISTNSKILSLSELGQYLSTKLSAEIFANNYRDFFAIDTNRIFFMYGPRQSKSMLIPRLIDSVVQGRDIQLAGHDGILINPVHVSDVAHFLNIQLQDSDSHVYNVAGPEVTSIRDLVRVIERSVGKAAIFQTLPPATNLVADATDFLFKLTARPVSVSEGIKDCISAQKSYW